jgi:hypothetical protein
MLPECDIVRVQVQKETENLDVGQLQIREENKEKYGLYKIINNLNSRNDTLKSQLTLYKVELGDFATLCKLLIDTNFLQKHNEKQINQVKDIVDINSVVD